MAASLLWMAAIFAMSARPADDSAMDSHRAGRLVLSAFYPHFRDLPAADQEILVARVDYPVRKAAHASEYAVLGALYGLTVLAFVETKRTPDRELSETNGKTPRAQELLWMRFPLRTAWCAAVLYAATDEFHQLFVPGRSGKVTDVLIDAAGAAVGVMIVCWVRRKHPERSVR